MTYAEKLVSIIVPVYNTEPYLNQCIDSILAQTYHNLEIIIIDDGATDNSADICESYSDSRIIVYHTENRGLSAARNYGIDKSHGEYIYFVDSDDWIDADLIEKAMKCIGDADIICFSPNEGLLSGYDALCALINERISSVAWCKLYRKNCFSKIRFPEGHVFEEVATAYKLLYQANNVVCANIVGYHYRFREGSITQTHNLSNVIDCWRAHKQRYDYCSPLVDSETYKCLLKSCAVAIAHAWAWKKEIPFSDSKEWKNMSSFARTYYSFSFRWSLPVQVHGAIILARYPNSLSFWIANKVNHLARKRRISRRKTV